MKKVVMMTLLAVTLTAQASETNDTTVIDNAQRVTIITRGGEQHITVERQNGDVYNKTVKVDGTDSQKKKDESGWTADIGVGFNMPTNIPDEVSIAPLKSWEVFFGPVYEYKPKGATQTYTAGLWLDWRSYAQRSNKQFQKDANSVVRVADYPSDEYKDRYSSVYTFSLSVPLLFTQQFGRGSKYSFTLGPVVNFNVFGRIHNEYDYKDDEVDISTKGIKYRPVTLDVMGAFNMGDVSIYCKYSPFSVLKKDKGPQFRSLSVGVYF